MESSEDSKDSEESEESEDNDTMSGRYNNQYMSSSAHTDGVSSDVSVSLNNNRKSHKNAIDSIDTSDINMISVDE